MLECPFRRPQQTPLSQMACISTVIVHRGYFSWEKTEVPSVHHQLLRTLKSYKSTEQCSQQLQRFIGFLLTIQRFFIVFLMSDLKNFILLLIQRLCGTVSVSRYLVLCCHTLPSIGCLFEIVGVTSKPTLL